MKHGYIERDGKKITSTGKGRNFIKVMPDEVKSAQLTADWENKLLEVERGNLSADSFMNEIDDFVKGLVAKYSSVDNSVSFSENQPSIGNCPKCAKPIVKGKYGWYCSARCGMNLTKVFGWNFPKVRLSPCFRARKQATSETAERPLLCRMSSKMSSTARHITTGLREKNDLNFPNSVWKIIR